MKKLTLLLLLAAYSFLPQNLNAQVLNDNLINYYVEINRVWTADFESGDDEPAWRFLWQANQSIDLSCDFANYQSGWCTLITTEGEHAVNQAMASETNKPNTDFISYSYFNWQNNDTFSDDCEYDSNDDHGNCGTRDVYIQSGNPCEDITELVYGFSDWCWMETRKAWRYVEGYQGNHPLIFGDLNNETRTHYNSNRSGPQGHTGYYNLWNAADLGFQASTDVTYAFQLTSPKRVTINTDFPETNYDTYIHLLSTNDQYNSFGYIEGNDDIDNLNHKSNLVKDLGPGYYYIIVEGFESATGLFKLSVSANDIPPANDAPCAAISVPTNGVVQSGFSNSGATIGAEEQLLAPTSGDCTTSWCPDDRVVQNSVWFSFVAPASGRVEISTCGLADFDTQIALYSASDCGNFATYTFVEANDDGPASCATDFDSWMDVANLSPGQTYYIMVDGYQGAIGTFGIYVKALIASATTNPELNQLTMTASPNPSNGNFKVEIDNLSAAAEFNITDLSGKTLYSEKVDATAHLIDIQLSTLPSGLYLMTLKTENRYYTQKMVIR